MWGAIIGAAAGLAGSLIGGHNARKERRRQRAIYKNQLAEARANALRYGNQDFSQSASAQDAIRQTRQLQEQSMQEARGADAVTGGNSVGRAITANAQAQENLSSNLAQQGEAQRQQARQYYGSQVQTAQNQLAGLHAQQAADNTAAGNQAMQAGMALATADLQSQMDTGEGVFGDGGKKTSSSPSKPMEVNATIPSVTYAEKYNGKAIEPLEPIDNIFGLTP